MIYAQRAYQEYRRIHAETGTTKKTWEELGHNERLAWQAAAFALIEVQNMKQRQTVQSE